MKEVTFSVKKLRNQIEEVSEESGTSQNESIQEIAKMSEKKDMGMLRRWLQNELLPGKRGLTAEQMKNDNEVRMLLLDMSESVAKAFQENSTSSQLIPFISITNEEIKLSLYVDGIHIRITKRSGADEDVLYRDIRKIYQRFEELKKDWAIFRACVYATTQGVITGF